jgi:hypothetical protein
LITNPGFETGDFTGWTTNAVAGAGVVCSNINYPAHSGNCAAEFSPGLGNFFNLSQSFATTPGASYTFDFWLSNDGADGSAISFSASWNGGTVFSLTNQSSSFAYTHEAFATVTATGTSTAISFSGDGNNGHRWVLDDVNVSANSTTPEPGTIGMVLCGFTALAGAWCRQRLAAFRQRVP